MAPHSAAVVVNWKHPQIPEDPAGARLSRVPYTSVFTIEGNGSYVDQGVNTPIGSYTIGSKVVGGGGEAIAHPFDVDFPVHSDRFQTVSVRFEALDVGHAAINSYVYRDLRDKGRRSLPIKTV